MNICFHGDPFNVYSLLNVGKIIRCIVRVCREWGCHTKREWSRGTKMIKSDFPKFEKVLTFDCTELLARTNFSH